MAGYLAMTDSRWAGHVQSLGFIDGVNFWSPSDRPLRNGIAGWHIYLFADPPGFKNKRRVTGFGNIRAVEVMPVSDAWLKFGDRNGAKSLVIFMKLLNEDRLHTAGSSPLSACSHIACHTIDDVQWLSDPLELDELDISIQRGVQRGRTLTSEEEAKLYRACLERLKRTPPPNKHREQ